MRCRNIIDRFSLLEYYAAQFIGPDRSKFRERDINFAYEAAELITYMKMSPLKDDWREAEQATIALATFFAIRDMTEEERCQLFIDTHHEMQQICDYLKASDVPNDVNHGNQFQLSVNDYFEVEDRLKVIQ